MAKCGGNSNTMNLLVSLAFVGLLSIANVGAVDIIFYDQTDACGGTGFSFNGVDAQVCCLADGGSVLVTSSDSCKTSQVYRNGGCSDNTPTLTGTGNICYIGGAYTAAFWFNSCRRRSLLSDDGCTSQGNPSGVVFTHDAAKGNWVLESSDAADLHSQLSDISDAEKVNWLQTRGAIFEPATVEIKNVVLN